MEQKQEQVQDIPEQKPREAPDKSEQKPEETKVKKQEWETLPVPCTRIFDTIALTTELGNGQPGRIEEFLQDYEREHPHKDKPAARECTLSIRQMRSGNIEYQFKTEGAAIGVRFEGIEQLEGNNEAAPKLLQLIMAKVIQQVYNLKKNPLKDPVTGKLLSSTPPDEPIILTPLELYTLGIFKHPKSAFVHTKELLDKLSCIRLRTSEAEFEEYCPLFRKYAVEKPNQHWLVYLNHEVKYWSWLIHFYCRFPVAGFSLSSKSFSILRYITVLMNLNSGKIKDQGYFVLTIDSLIERLRLNREDKHKDRALVKPIKSIIDEINDKQNLGIRLELDVAKDSIQGFLSGRVKVYVDPELLRKWKLPKQDKRSLPK